MVTRAAINSSVWIVSLALQCALLAAVSGRGVARRWPLLTVLLVFYPLRSAVLFGLFGHLAPASYASIYNALSIADVLLQLAVAVEIAVHLLHAAGGWTRRGVLLLLLLPSVAFGATLLYCRILPGNTPVPPDRLQMFDSFVMIQLCAWALSRPAPALLRRITMGFAFYGAFDLLVTGARIFAANHHDARAFAQWSYALSAAYLMVILYWIVVLRPASPGLRASVPQPGPAVLPVQ